MTYIAPTETNPPFTSPPTWPFPTTSERWEADYRLRLLEAATIYMWSHGSTMPGINQSPGADNSTVIMNYLNSLPYGGISAPLPAGPIPIGNATPLVIPAGVALIGSGWFSIAPSAGSPVSSGTVIVPSTNNPPTGALVRISNDNSSLNQLSINAGLACQYALDVGGSTRAKITNCGIYGGSLGALQSSTGAAQPNIINCTISVNSTAGGPFDLNQQGGDWIVTGCRFLIGTKTMGGVGNAGCQFSNCHFTHGSNSIGLANVIDNGGIFYTGCYFDSIGPGGNALVDRSNAVSFNSTYTGCRFYQNTNGVTGIPVILETPNAGGGAIINGCMCPNSVGTSTFTYFIQNPVASTVVNGINIAGSMLTGGFTNTIPPPGTFFGVTIAQVGAALGGMFPGSNLITPNGTALLPAPFGLTPSAENEVCSTPNLIPGVYLFEGWVTVGAVTTAGGGALTFTVASGAATGMTSVGFQMGTGAIGIGSHISSIITITGNPTAINLSVFAGPVGAATARTTTLAGGYGGATGMSWTKIG